jgi:hypothetical protein
MSYLGGGGAGAWLRWGWWRIGTPVSVLYVSVRCMGWRGEWGMEIGDWGLRWTSRIKIPSSEYGFGKWVGELKMWVWYGRID